jgi:hypothetical protein
MAWLPFSSLGGSRLGENEIPKELNAWLFARRDSCRHAAKAWIDGGERKLDRVTESFATIYAAGCAAIQLKVLTWSERGLGEALLRCEQAHVEEVADKLPDPLTKKIGPGRRLASLARICKRAPVGIHRSAARAARR